MNDVEQTEETRLFFDTAAPGWTSRYSNDNGVSIRKSRFADAIAGKFARPADILDFGCGSGDISLHLSSAGHRLTGYDLSNAMIAEARRADPNGRVRWLSQSDRSEIHLEFETATFDAIVASSVFEYLPDVDQTLAELSRLLRPNGWLFATVPDMRDPRRRMERWLRVVAMAPGLSAILHHSRWREGATYLRISGNRMSPNVWLQSLRKAGLSPEPLAAASGPLLLLTARKQP